MLREHLRAVCSSLAGSFTGSIVVIRINIKCYSNNIPTGSDVIEMDGDRGSSRAVVGAHHSFLFAEKSLNAKHVNTEMVLVWAIIPQNMYFWHKGHRQNTF